MINAWILVNTYLNSHNNGVINVLFNMCFWEAIPNYWIRWRTSKMFLSHSSIQRFTSFLIGTLITIQYFSRMRYVSSSWVVSSCDIVLRNHTRFTHWLTIWGYWNLVPKNAGLTKFWAIGHENIITLPSLKSTRFSCLWPVWKNDHPTPTIALW